MKRFTNRLSPATVIACIALFVSLGGVSYGVATGSIDTREIKNNTIRGKDIRNGQVFTQDIRNGQVFTQDIRNSTVRSRDVRNNTLTGADILESSLGKVPSAASADNATTANRASSAGSVDRVQISNQVTANDGQTVTILEAGGFRISLVCDTGAPEAEIRITNVSAGDDSMFDDNVNGSEEDDFNQGDSSDLNSETSLDSNENSAYSALGSGGSAIHGQTSVALDPSAGFGGADCGGAATALG